MNAYVYRPKLTDFLAFMAAVVWAGVAAAAPLLPVNADNTGALSAAVASDRLLTDDTDLIDLAPNLRRQLVNYSGGFAAGTVVIDTDQTYLYYVLGNGRAIRYGIGVGREGFTWSGVKSIGRKAEWPDWYPPQAMIERQPYLARMTAGGPGNPLGARAMYIAGTEYRIHGTNAPSTIGKQVSSGCIRLTNEDVTDLYSRVEVGTKIVVLPNHRAVARIAATAAPARLAQRPNYDTRSSNIY